MTTEVPDSMIVQIDQSFKPNISSDDVILLCKNLYGLTVTSVKEHDSYDDRCFYIQVEDHWANEFITELWPHGYSFKVLNNYESLKKHYEAEHDMQKILKQKGFVCPNVVPNIYGQNSSLEKIYLKTTTDTENECQNNNQKGQELYSLHLCRLFTFIPGKVLHGLTYTHSLLYELGQYVARLHGAWQGFHHQHLDNYRSTWCLNHIHELEAYIGVVKNKRHKEIIHSVVKTFQDEVLTNCKYFRKGVTHADVNDNNVIVQEKPSQNKLPLDEEEYEIHGIIDFGDAQDMYYVFDVGITMVYSSLESKVIDPLLAGSYALAGYLSLRDLNEKELDALRSIMAARYAQSLVMGLHAYSKDPTNTYTLQTTSNGWTQLENLWTTPKETLYAKWRDIIDSYKP